MIIVEWFSLHLCEWWKQNALAVQQQNVVLIFCSCAMESSKLKIANFIASMRTNEQTSSTKKSAHTHTHMKRETIFQYWVCLNRISVCMAQCFWWCLCVWCGVFFLPLSSYPNEHIVSILRNMKAKCIYSEIYSLLQLYPVCVYIVSNVTIEKTNQKDKRTQSLIRREKKDKRAFLEPSITRNFIENRSPASCRIIFPYYSIIHLADSKFLVKITECIIMTRNTHSHSHSLTTKHMIFA